MTSEEKNEQQQEEKEVAAEKKAEKPVKAVALPGFYGVKAGMTRIFGPAGNHIPVTIIKLIPNFITQVKTLDKDGYEAYQLGHYEKREKLLTKPVKGILSRARVKKNLTRFAEIKTTEADPAHLGCEVSLENFPPATLVDVMGISKGKGFQGVIKRWNFSQGPLSHGSKFHRTGGAIGNRATPSRVWKNKKMPGHMGMVKKTMQNLEVVEVSPEKGYLLIKGSVPGARQALVRIQRAVKGQRQKGEN